MFVCEMPVIAVFAFVGCESIRRQFMLEFRQASAHLSGFFVWIADLVSITDPAFLWLVWLIVPFH